MRRSIAVLGLALVAAACTASEEPTPQSTLVVATTEPLGDLDPARCYEYLCAYVVAANVHEGLVSLDAGPPVRPVPALAERWEVTDDGRTYRFRLRHGATLHDGTEVTSAVVERSLQLVREAARDDGPGFLLFDTLDPPDATHGIVSVDTPSEDVVEIKLAEPDSSFLARLAFPVASVVSPSDDGPPAGAGPYAVTSQTPDGIAFEQFAGYHNEVEGPERVEVRFVRSADALRTDLTSGDAHIGVREWSLSEIATLERARGINTATVPGAGTRFLAFDTSDEPYDSPDLRRAIAAGIDRGLLVGETLSETGRELRSLVPEGFFAARPVFDDTGQEAVERHLEEAGVDDEEKVEIDLWYTPSHYGDAEQAVAETLERSLEGTGRFDVELHSAEWADYKSSFTRGQYGMFLLGWFPNVLDPLDYLDPFMASETAAGLGVSYHSEEADELLADARNATDDDAHQEALVRLQELLASDVPYVPLWQPDRVVGLADGVGVELDLTQQMRFGSVDGI